MSIILSAHGILQVTEWMEKMNFCYIEVVFSKNVYNINFYRLKWLSCGAMVARLTSNQKAAGSSPASGMDECNVWYFLF